MQFTSNQKISLWGFFFFLLNYIVGALAKVKLFKSPMIHRLLFIVNIIFTVLILRKRPKQFLLPALSIGIMPFTRPEKISHPTVASLGLFAYCHYIYKVIIDETE